ncbi:hypothetical protein FDP41_007153 [Naegleria fowleri]|uniref:Endonuclease/exonuclease/phosphatase domain-containing protein n=1 Tax=Naegleria fowleri TaxID=5763 RepID=A0A6A5BGI2_NAEFO|nr:uncharacterized protein FDP41_007153 [Naegleria fowleri]KAF0973766.1 hypothetical protein FDP41_007153 [Naegleria fowleri]
MVAFTTNSVEEVLATVAMNADTLYDSRVVNELDCIILFFKSRKLANQAISAGAKSKLTMIPQTVKTSFRYKVDKDLDKTNMHSIISTLGSSINNINFSKMDDQEFWAIGTNIELPANHLKKFKLSKMRTDISRFRTAFNDKENDLPKLKGAISSQWKVKIENIELANKMAVVGIKKDQITNNITKFVQVGVACIFNWYGPANKNKLEFMNKALNIINISAQTAVFHGERIVILGDLNANTKTFSKVSYAAHERLLIDQCDKLKLFDVVPISNTPSFAQRNKYSHGFSRPDHIITSHNDYSGVEDVPTAYSHKLL